MRSPVCRAGGAGRGPGLTVTVVEGSHVPGSVWPAAVVVRGGWMMGRLEMGMLARVWPGVVLGGRLCGGGGRWWEGSAGCGGWRVLAWVSVWVRAVSLGFVSLRLWCCVCLFGRRLGFGVRFGVGVRFQVEEDLSPEV